MPRVSKRRELTPEKQNLFLDDFYSAITSLKDKNEVRVFFNDLLTKEEKLMLAKRLQITIMLKLGYFWDEIDERVKVTRETINNLRFRLDFGSGGLDKIAQRIINLKREKLESFEKGKGRRSDLGTAVAKGGLGIFLQQRRRRRRKKSVVS